MAKRLICATLINLALILSPGLAKAVAPSMLGVSPALKASFAPSIWETNHLPRLLSRRYNRFEPGSLPERLVEEGKQYLQTPYRRGCSLQTGKSTDCSGFVQYLYRQADIRLPRASAEQARMGKVAARSLNCSRLQPGDLLFFRDGGRHIGHVGLYLGEGKMIHAASHGHGVMVSDLHNPYYRSNFVVAKRLLAAPQTDLPSTSKIPARPAIN
jgi:hypothetical protein